MRYRLILKRLPLVALVGLALGLALQGKALAQQEPQITSVFKSVVLTDPKDSGWRNVPSAELPLTPQVAIKPALSTGTVSSVKVRSVNDGKSIAFLLEWKDETRDATASRQDSFRDAAAIQFPIGEELPAICMGVRGQMVNIWHWKADWQEDIDKGFQDVVDAFPNFYKDTYPGGVSILTGKPPFRMPEDFDTPAAKQFILGWSAGNAFSQPVKTSPIEDLNAIGFSTVTHKAKQNVQGKGAWESGTWRVVFTRALKVDDVDAAGITPGQQKPVAVAVWNGSNQEVGARKQTSTFLTVLVEAGTGAPAGQNTQTQALILAGVLLVLIAGGAVAYRVFGRSGQRAS